MRPFLRLSALAIAIAFVALAATPAARADAGKPAWTPGDFWVYNVTGTNLGVSGPGTMRLDVLALDTVNVGGTDYPSYRVRLGLNVSGAATFNAGEAWYRVSDLALAKQTYNLTVDIPFIGRVDFLTTITFNPPQPITWPLTAGGTWSSTTQVSTSTQVGGFPPGTNVFSLSTDYIVQSSATVSVPAGTFDTTPLRATTTGYVVAYWAPAAGNHARQQSFDDNSAEVQSAELSAYRYQGGGFLGLSLVVWFLIAIVLVVIVAAYVFRTRSHRAQPPMPPYAPPQAPPR